MEEGPFLNREITTALGNIHDDIKEIKTQTIKTNGRVSSLENWRWFIGGGLVIISVLILPLLFITINKLFDALKEKETPTTALEIQEKYIELTAEAEKLKAQIQANQEPSPDPL